MASLEMICPGRAIALMLVAGLSVSSAGADLMPLRSMGVPLIDLRADATYYFDYHHTADDTLDKVDPEDLAQSVAAYAIAAYWAAEREGILGRPAIEEAGR